MTDEEKKIIDDEEKATEEEEQHTDEEQHTEEEQHTDEEKAPELPALVIKLREEFDTKLEEARKEYEKAIAERDETIKALIDGNDDEHEKITDEQSRVSALLEEMRGTYTKW